MQFATTAVKNTMKSVMNDKPKRWLNLVESLFWGAKKTDRANRKEPDKKRKSPKRRNGTAILLYLPVQDAAGSSRTKTGRN